MSQANASARARRAFTPAVPQNQGPTNQTSGVTSPGLTLPQVISIIDNRLIKLESFMKDTKDRSSDMPTTINQIANPDLNNNMVDEFNHRFNILVEEIGNLKDIVLKLQSYTMEVNKTLYEERVHVFSELGDNVTSLQNNVNVTTTLEEMDLDEKDTDF